MGEIGKIKGAILEHIQTQNLKMGYKIQKTVLPLFERLRSQLYLIDILILRMDTEYTIFGLAASGILKTVSIS